MRTAFPHVCRGNHQDDLQSATQSELYGYDDVYRVTGFKRGQLNEQKTDITSPSRTQTWTLDPLGNWDETVLDSVTESRTHNTVNELTARTIGEDPQISLTYDSAGNLTQDGDSNGDHKYTWDYRNRLIEVEEKQSGNWNTTGEYKYDAQGRRVLKTVTNKGSLNGTTRFIWGGEGDWQCLEERDSSGDLVARFTYAPGYIDAVAVQERDLNSDTDFADANEIVYYHANTLFSVYALSDANGTMVERYRYDAYGAATVLDADGSADADGLSDLLNPYVFTGRRLDLETGNSQPSTALLQYRNRYYHTALGRFISRDPEDYGDCYGLYVYVTGKPGANVDPFGRDSLTGVWELYPSLKRTAYGREWRPHPQGERAGLEYAVEWAQWASPRGPWRFGVAQAAWCKDKPIHTTADIGPLTSGRQFPGSSHFRATVYGMGWGQEDYTVFKCCKRWKLRQVIIELGILKVGSRVSDNSGYETTWKCATT